MSDVNRLIKIDEAARYLGVSVRQVRALVADDGLPYVQVSPRARRFRTGDIDRWADARAFQLSISPQEPRRSTGAASRSTGCATDSPLAAEIRARLMRKLDASMASPRSENSPAVARDASQPMCGRR